MAAPFAKKLYASKAWRQCRDAYVAYRHGICERCGAPGVEVHHKRYLTPANIDDAEIVFGWDNLELLCRDCHIAEHEKKKNLRRSTAKESDMRYTFDASGQPVPRGQVKIVWGSPASGKSTFVREHMQHMDIVIDLDAILLCFTGLKNMTDDPAKITDYLPFVLDVREAVYRLIARDMPKGISTAWIIAGLPRRADRATLFARFPNAQFVHMDCTCEQAIARSEADASKPNKERMRKIITDYFRNFEP